MTNKDILEVTVEDMKPYELKDDSIGIEVIRDENDTPLGFLLELKGDLRYFTGIYRHIARDKAYNNSDDPDTEKKLKRFFKLMENHCGDCCFVCEEFLEYDDTSASCLSDEFDIYVCEHCAKAEIEFLKFVKMIITR